jgi:hypothetical protein
MKRSTWILLGILVALGLITFLVLQRHGEISSSGSLGEKLVTYDSSAVDRLDISSSRQTAILAREGGRWMMKEPLSYPADEGFVNAAIGKGASLELKNLVSSNPQKQNLFQVDSTGTFVRVYERGSQKTAFWIGKTGPSYTETYVRRDGSNDVYLADGMFGYMFTKQPKDWRDKSIFKADPFTIPSVRFHYGDTTFALTRPDSVWLADQDSTVQSAVTGFLGTLANLQTDNFVDSAVTLAKPNAVIEVGGVQLQFYFNKDANKYTVTTSMTSQVFEILPWRASQVLKRKRDFIPARG